MWYDQNLFKISILTLTLDFYNLWKAGINGTFKIRRGTNECGIESMGINAGTFNNNYLRIN